MCGIVGIVAQSDICAADKSAVQWAMQRMLRRGPDGSGLWDNGSGVVLGHRRLAILDPESGQQPWHEPDHGLVLSFNGEIYNYPELRESLSACGYQFRTHCDTEVLAKAYLHWGRDCLQHLNGMFAFALYDRRSDSVWLARDRLGIKPLYYSLGSGSLVFASAPHVLLEFSGVSRRMHPTAVLHYLQTIRTNLDDQTVFADVKILPPGHHLHLDIRCWQVRRSSWWQVPQTVVSEVDAVEDCARHAAFVARTVDDAVRIQLLSDVPLGGFLSGGLDSCILTSAATSTVSKERFKVFSVGYAHAEGTTEWDYMRVAKSYYGIRGEEVLLDGMDFWSDWHDLIAEKGLPLSTPNEVPILRMARACKKEFTVALTGEGADEVFGGYAGPTFCGYDYDRLRTQPRSVSLNALLRGYGKASFTDPLDLYFQVNSWISPDRLRHILRPTTLGWNNGVHPEILAFYQQWLGTGACADSVDAFMRIHLRVNLEGLLLRLDSSTMAASVEGRVPFTDHRLVEHVFQLPTKLRMAVRAGTGTGGFYDLNALELIQRGCVDTKKLLRQAYAQRVPEQVLQRAKMSFPVPFQQWMRGHLAEPISDILNSSQWMSAWFQPSFFNGYGNSGGNSALETWPLVNLAIWAKSLKLQA